MRAFLKKIGGLVRKAEEKELGIKLGMILVIALLFWFFFLADNSSSREDYRGDYGGSDYLD